MSSVRRVQSIRVEDGFLIITYNDCTEEQIPYCEDCDEQPSENPGDYPDPIDDPNSRCRVAIHVGEFAALRLMDYLNGLNLSSSIANFIEAYVTAKIASYGWPISVYNSLRSFTYGLFTSGGAGSGAAAKADYDAHPGSTTTEVQTALWCSLDTAAQLTALERDTWATVYLPLGGAFNALLGSFVFECWPLDNLRQLAFEASLNTESVSCAGFTCGDPDEGGDCEITSTTQSQFLANVSGIWGSAPLISYGSPARPARSVFAGEITLTTPTPLCVTRVMISVAGQSGQTAKKWQLMIDDVPYPVATNKDTATCNTNLAASVYWDIAPPREGQEFKFVIAEAGGGSGNPAAPVALHCAHITHGV